MQCLTAVSQADALGIAKTKLGGFIFPILILKKDNKELVCEFPKESLKNHRLIQNQIEKARLKFKNKFGIDY